uniref:RanBP2-type domain-containing protein n=1 Tax=Macrostomum lignano TaxID=282301 RepID=A0A1I8F248_9PLAT
MERHNSRWNSHNNRLEQATTTDEQATTQMEQPPTDESHNQQWKQPQQQMEQPQQQMETAKHQHKTATIKQDGTATTNRGEQHNNRWNSKQQMEQPRTNNGTATTADEQASNRLGQCQRCNTWAARYTCPSCLSQHLFSNLLNSSQTTNRFLESVDSRPRDVMRLSGRSRCALLWRRWQRKPRTQQAAARACQAILSRQPRHRAGVHAGRHVSQARATASHLRQGRQAATASVDFQLDENLPSAPDTSRLSEIFATLASPVAEQQPGLRSLCRLDQGDKLCPIDCNQSLADLLRGTTVVEFPVATKSQLVSSVSPDSHELAAAFTGACFSQLS